MSTSKYFSSNWTEQCELYLYWRDSKQYARKCESIASILPVVSTIIATVCNPMQGRFPAWGLAVVMKWLQLSNARNMLMTVNIKLSIIVIDEIIPSTDDTCLLQSISPQNGLTEQNELYLYWRDSKQYARKCESIDTTGCFNYYCNRMPNSKA